jgi:hypothetical protein
VKQPSSWQLCSPYERRWTCDFAVRYLPKSLPTDETATLDKRYTRFGEIRRTDGQTDKFTAREPVQNWLDLLADGVHPSQVRVLGINGGNIAGLEYRLAVALGATVGVIQGSGREAETVIDDWPGQAPQPIAGADLVPSVHQARPPGRLISLPKDPMTLRAFLHMRVGTSPETRAPFVETAARLAHEDFLEQQRYSNPDPVMQPWPKLREDLQNSNMSQIEYLISILQANGFGVRPLGPRNKMPNDPKFTEDEIKKMGNMEHGRWNVERLYDGWRYAKKKDAQKRLTPYIKPFDELDEGVKKWDFLNVKLWPEILADVEYEIYRE